MDNKELLHLLSLGDESAYEFIFKHFYRPLTLFAYKYVADVDVAKDIVQELFLQLFEKKSRLNVESNLKAFLYQSVRNRCINHLKANKLHSKHHSHIFNLNSDDVLVDHDEIVHSELEDRIASLVKELPNQCRKIFEMSRYDEIPNQEIADSLGISKRTVETQISVALKRLRVGLVDVTLFLALGFAEFYKILSNF